MNFDEMQRIVSFAKKARLKSITMDGVTFEFFERGPRKKRAPKSEEPSTPIRQEPKPPTLDDINKFIYDNREEIPQ